MIKIYQYKSKTSGKAYIGQTSAKIETRSGYLGKKYLLKKKSGNWYHPKFAPAILEYGWDDFELTILAECKTFKEADELEKFFIKKNNSFLDGYNDTDGGQRNHIFSERAKKQMSESHKLLCGKNSPLFGYKRSKEEREKLSKRISGPNSPNYGKSNLKKQKIKFL